MRLALAASLICLLPIQAFAQDDLLAPLAPEPNKPKAQKKPKAKAEPKAKAPTARRIKEEKAKKPPQLAITVKPDDATLTLDGNEMGPVPDHPIEVSPGEHQIVLKRQGYADVQVKIKAIDGQTAVVKETLEASSGILAVTADIAGSEVTVDGRSMGAAPVRDLSLSPGMHEVLVKHEGYEDDLSRISVRAGKQYTVSAHLKAAETKTHEIVAQSDRPAAVALTPAETTETQVPPPTEEESTPVLKRWYVWAGAVAVAGGIVAGVVLVNRSNQSGGGVTLTPTAVCQGPCSGTINAPSALHF